MSDPAIIIAPRVPTLLVRDMSSKRIVVAGFKGDAGPEGPPSAGIHVLGNYTSLSALQTAHPAGSAGDAYTVAGDLYVWDSDTAAWSNAGAFVGPEGNSDFTLTAGVALAYPRVVSVNGSSAYYPDLTNTDDVARIIGITTQASASGDPVIVTSSKTFTESAWSWLPGRIYCAASGGMLTQTAPTVGAVIEVARAINSTTIRAGIKLAILR